MGILDKLSNPNHYLQYIYDESHPFILELTNLIGKSLDDIIDYYQKENSIVLINSDFVKSIEWPKKGFPFKKKFSDPFPFVWGVFDFRKKTNISITFFIHPTKCFPGLYDLYNSNSIIDPINIQTERIDGIDYNISLCLNPVRCDGTLYNQDNRNENCYNFGLPDSCFDNESSLSLENYLSNLNPSNIIVLKKTNGINFIEQSKHKLISINSDIMPESYLLRRDRSIDMISSTSDKKNIKKFLNNLWFESVRTMIRQRHHLNSDENVGIEDFSLETIINKLESEFIRLSYILFNQNRFLAISNQYLSSSFCYDKNVLETFNQITNRLELEYNQEIDTLLSNFEKKGLINSKLHTNERYYIFDVEYINSYLPKQLSSNKKYNFPAIFVSIIWNGRNIGLTLKIHPIYLPCHFCLNKCKNLKNNEINFSCLKHWDEFIKIQKNHFQFYLNKYQNLRLVCYGKSDPTEFDHANVFLWRDKYTFQRKGRINRKQLSQIVIDLNKGKKLRSLENSFIKKKYPEWQCLPKHKNVNKSLLKIKDLSPNWERGYEDAITTCIHDTIITWVYYLLKTY